MSKTIKFSISEYTDNQLDSRNAGVAELMLIECCNKCIELKSKWLMAINIVYVSRNHLHRSSIPEYEELIPVVSETPPYSLKHFPDMRNYGSKTLNRLFDLQYGK